MQLYQLRELELVILLFSSLFHHHFAHNTRVQGNDRDHNTALYNCTMSDIGGMPFHDWSFSNNSPLLELPVDPMEENYVRRVYNVSFSRVLPTPFQTKPYLVALQEEVLRDTLDLDPCDCAQSEEFLAMASGGQPLPQYSLTLAHRYGGHQFGHWAGQLGDGRAVLMGTYLNRKGEYWEVQLKGSGKTPYSRDGDGRAVVRSSIREFLASEAMYALGVPTSRAASLVVSSDTVWRDQFYDGHPKQEKTAVVLRLAPSWFRIGSLEILQHHHELHLLQQTIDLVIERHYPDLALHHRAWSRRYTAFFAEVVNRTAGMVARWQSVGFTHGVCNTDNFSLLSLTIDYGPFGLMERYDPNFVPNTSDDEGMYCYQCQPSVAYHNLMKLQMALRPLVTDESDRKDIHEILMLYPAAFNNAFLTLMSEKLGIGSGRGVGARDEENLIIGLLKMMEDQKADFTMTFRELSGITLTDLVIDKLPGHTWVLPRLLAHDAWRGWLGLYQSLSHRLPKKTQMSKVASYFEGMRMENMLASNPRYILRNWMAEEAIQRAEDDGDYSVVHRLQRILRNPFVEQPEAERAGYARSPPLWAHDLKVSCSS